MRRAAAVLLLLAACGRAAADDEWSRTAPTQPVADCSRLVVTGNPQSALGATWTYDSTDDGVHYVLEGVLFTPPGGGPYAGIVVSHGKGGTPRGYSAAIGRTFVTWNLVVIGPMYTHAPDAEDAGNEPQGPDGASDANVLRAHKARDLLSCLGTVDLGRVAAHGHSMGAFVTGQLLGRYPADFVVASHTAGGAGPGPNATQPAVAAQIRTPYSLHHSRVDAVVPVALDEALRDILAAKGVEHRLLAAPYRGLTHAEIALHPEMLRRVLVFYVLHGLVP